MIYFIGNESLFSHFKTATKQDVLDYCNSKTVIGVDIETCRKFAKNRYNESVYKPGLDPFVSNICMLQIGDVENQYIIDARYIKLDFLKQILESKDILKVGHNLKFESKFLKVHYNIDLKNVHDTMITEKILYNGEKLSYSLEALMKRHLGYQNKLDNDLFNVEEEESDDFEEMDNPDGIEALDFKEKLYVDKSIRTNFVEIGDRPFTIAEIEYGAKDIITPIQLYQIQLKGREISYDDHYYPEIGIKLENDFIFYLAKIELRGVNVDSKQWLDLYAENKKDYIVKRQKLDTWLEEFHPKFVKSPDLFNSKCLADVDWQSPKEVIKLAKYLDCCPKEKSKFTGKIEDTVGAKAIFKLLTNENKELFFKGTPLDFKDKDDTQAFILNYLLFKKSQLLTTTFGEDWLRYIHPITGKVHTSFQQLMSTSRMSSTNPNLHAEGLIMVTL